MRQNNIISAVWLRNRLISAGLKPILSQCEKSFMVSYYRQFSKKNKIKIIKSIQVQMARAFGNPRGQQNWNLSCHFSFYCP